MRTFLLTWKKWPWTDLPQAVAATAKGEKYRQEWTIAAHKQARPGDRVFVMRLGSEKPGIIASGSIVGGPVLRPHWNLAERGRMVPKVVVDLDTVVSPDHVLPRSRLRGGVLDKATWAPQASGIAIPDDAAAQLEEIWREWLVALNAGISEQQAGSDWSRREVDAIVSDYFDMLAAENAGQPYSKTEHRRTLLAQLPGRSGPSIEFKHRNISAVLVEDNLPYIDGYKPAGNYQELLATAVDSYLDEHTDFFRTAVEADSVAPVARPKPDECRIEDILEQPPTAPQPPRKVNKERPKKGQTPRRPSKELGDAGEQFVLGLEKRYLHEHGRDDLAARVEWVACTRGDGLGYDILSFDEYGSEKYIEVKTTTLSANTAFYFTANEFDKSRTEPEKFWLYRVYKFGKAPKLFRVQGAVDAQFAVEPVVYIVHPQ